jgi:hypothetical protein
MSFQMLNPEISTKEDLLPPPNAQGKHPDCQHEPRKKRLDEEPETFLVLLQISTPTTGLIIIVVIIVRFRKWRIIIVIIHQIRPSPFIADVDQQTACLNNKSGIVNIAENLRRLLLRNGVEG